VAEEGGAEAGADPGDGLPNHAYRKVDSAGTEAPEWEAAAPDGAEAESRAAVEDGPGDAREEGPEAEEETSGSEPVVAWDDDEGGVAVGEYEAADPEDDPRESENPWPDEPEDTAEDDHGADAKPPEPEPAEGNEEAVDESASADAERSASER
jgi:hypothetical protein